MPSESDEPPDILVIFLGGPCDGLEQRSRTPPPTPEYPQPRAGTIDAVYRITRQNPFEYVYEFTGYRERTT